MPVEGAGAPSPAVPVNAISVIIPAYNAGATIAACVESALSGTVMPLEVIVVDDNSRDDTVPVVTELAARHPGLVRLVRMPANAGPAICRNAGAAEARGELYFFLDSDTVVLADTLENFLRRIPEADAVSGIYHPEPLNEGATPRHKAYLLAYCFGREGVFEHDVFNAASAGIRASVFRAIGGFSTDLPWGLDVENEEFGHRITAKHRHLMDPSINVRHHFAGFGRLTRNYFHRVSLWMELFLQRGRFEKGGNVTGEVGASTAAAALAATLLPLLPFFPALRLWAAASYALHLYGYLGYFAFVARRRPSFLAPAVALSFWFSIVLSAGAAYGGLRWLTGTGRLPAPMRRTSGLPGGRVWGMLRAFLDSRQVGYLIFYVTNRCNMRCPFCFYRAEVDKGAKPDEMTAAEIRRMADRLGPLLQLSLTGGEPFLRDDLPEIARILLERTGAPCLTIPTNGSLTARIVRFLGELLPAFPGTRFRLALSIEGVGEEHDDIRSAPGSFQKVRETYHALAPLRAKFGNLAVDANAVYSARSEASLLGTLQRLAREFEFDNLSVTFARGELKDPALKDAGRDRYQAINEFLGSLRRRKERGLLYPFWRGVRDVSRQDLMQTVFADRFVAPCVAGRKLVVVSETGDVYPCELLGRKMGSLRDFGFDLGALMRSAQSRELVAWIRSSRCKCSFECALAANVVWTPSSYPRLAVSAVKNIGRGGGGA